MNYLEGLKRYRNLMELEMNDDVPEEMLNDAYDECAASVVEAADDFVEYLHHREAHAAVIKEYIERAKRALKSYERGTKWIRGAAAAHMAAVNMPKVAGTVSKLSVRDTESVEIVDATKLPEAYTTAKIEYVPDKTAIKKALKAGEDVPGAGLITKKSLYIR